MSLPPTAKEDEEAASFAALEADIREYLRNCQNPGGSPLAYVNLGKAGRTDLVSRIMEAGGYIEVSRRLNLPVDEKEFIPPPPSFSNALESTFTKVDPGASLAIGRDLEARMEAFGRQPQGSSRASRSSSAVKSRKQTDNVPSAEQLQQQNERIIPPVVDDRIPEGERFVLTGSMRVGMLILSGLCSVGFGQSSPAVLSEDAIAVCQAMAGALACAHVVVALYAGLVLAPKLKRGPGLWFFKALLSGPLGLQYLRSLGPL